MTAFGFVGSIRFLIFGFDSKVFSCGFLDDVFIYFLKPIIFGKDYHNEIC